MKPTVEVGRAPLLALVDAAKRHVRQHGGPTNGCSELANALEGVVKDLAASDLREEMSRPAAEKEVGT